MKLHWFSPLPPARTGIAEYSVMLSEAQFAAQPFAVGNAVQLAWTPESAHALQA